MQRKNRDDNSVNGNTNASSEPGAVGKRTNRLSTPRGTKDGNLNRIVDRETAILKVRYPFLPLQQLRGKALKGLGIPAVMGSARSQVSAATGATTPDDVPKTSNKNGPRMSQVRETSNLESGVGIFGRSDKHEAETSANVDETAENEETINVVSDEPGTPTPELIAPDEDERRSIFARSTQRFRQNLLLQASQIKSEMMTAPTQIDTPDFRRSNAAFVVSPICSQIVSPAELPSQVDVERVDVNFGGDFFSRAIALSPLGRKTGKSPSPTRSSSAGSGGEKETAPTPFDTIDINDLTQLPTPGTYPFKLLCSLSQATTTSGCSRSGYGQSSEILARKIAEVNLKRRRNADVCNDDDEVEENDLAKENFGGQKGGTRNFGLNAYSKDQLKPRHSESPSMALRNRYDENVPSSEDESPKAKKRRMVDEISPSFVTEDCGLTPFPSSRRKKTVKFFDDDKVDLTSVERDSNLCKILKNSSLTRETSQKEKSSLRKSNSSFADESGSSRSRSHVNFDDEILPSFVTENCGLTPFPGRRRNKSVQFTDGTDEDATSVQTDPDIRENRNNSSLTSAAKLERKSSLRKSSSLGSDETRSVGSRSHVNFSDEVSSSYATVDCGSTPFHPREKKKHIEFPDGNDEEKTTSLREASDVDKNEKIPWILPVANQEERSTSRCAEKSREVRRLDFGDEETSSSFVTKNCGLTPFHLVVSDEENSTSLQGVFSDDENEKKSAVEPDTLVSSLVEKWPSFSVEDIGAAINDDLVCAREETVETSVCALDDDCRDKSSLKSENAERQIVIVRNDVCDNKAIAVDSTNVLFDERDGISSTTVVNDVCNNIPTVESSGIIFTGDHKEESSDSASTYFSGAAAAETPKRREFLSDFCCEYDQSFQSEKAQELNIDSARLAKFMNDFRVPTATINREVNEILKFLDTDIENN